MSKDEILKQKQESMPDSELIEKARNQIIKMCKTGGRSFTMSVPVEVDDTDMLFSELIRRFEKLVIPATDAGE